MIKDNIVVEPYPVAPVRQVCWTAIFVGALVAVGLGFLLNLFGLAIGLSTFIPNKDGAVVLAIGGLLGVMIGIVVAMVTAGFAAGYLGRGCCTRRHLGIVYGFTTWTIALLISAVVTAHVGNYVSSYSSNISRSVFVVQNNQNNVEAVTVETAPAANDSQQQALQVTATPATLAWSTFIVFLLFFIGAISCCFGACWGMTCRRVE